MEVQAAAEREEKIQQLTDEAKTALQGIAALRKAKGSGRPPKTGPAGSELKNEWEHKLARLQRGLLPGESDGAGARKAEQLLAAAQAHPADHAGAGDASRHDYAQHRAAQWNNLPARGGGAAAAGDPDADHDDPDGGGDGGGGGAWDDSSDDEPPEQCPKSDKVSKAQHDFITKCTHKVVSRTADNYKFLPPCASMQPRASAALFLLKMVVVWLPHVIWRKLGIPPQSPCPVHGLPMADENDFVTPKGMAQPRRFCGVTHDTSGFLVGSLSIKRLCSDCTLSIIDISSKRSLNDR